MLLQAACGSCRPRKPSRREAEFPRAVAMMKEIYSPVLAPPTACPVHSHCPPVHEVPLIVTDTNSAELVKHASNSFLAMKISFINLVADACEAAGADIAKVAEGIGSDQRIGQSFLNPGIGFGGFCFPKDLQAFVRIGERLGCDFSLLKEVEKINLRRAEQFVAKVKNELGSCVAKPWLFGDWHSSRIPMTFVLLPP